MHVRTRGAQIQPMSPVQHGSVPPLFYATMGQGDLQGASHQFTASPQMMGIAQSMGQVFVNNIGGAYPMIDINKRSLHELERNLMDDDDEQQFQAVQTTFGRPKRRRM